MFFEVIVSLQLFDGTMMTEIDQKILRQLATCRVVANVVFPRLDMFDGTKEATYKRTKLVGVPNMIERDSNWIPYWQAVELVADQLGWDNDDAAKCVREAVGQRKVISKTVEDGSPWIFNTIQFIEPSSTVLLITFR